MNSKVLKKGIFAVLLLLTLTGLLSAVQRFMFISPSRAVTDGLEESAESHDELIDHALELIDVSGRKSSLEPCGKALSGLQGGLEFSKALTVASLVAVHIVNIYLIVSGPAGLILMALLFIFLLILAFRDSNRLRNASMATGLAAFVFVAAIPMSVMISGQVSRLWTSGLRYGFSRKIERFENRFLELEEEAMAMDDPQALFNDLSQLQKGLDGSAVGSSASLLVEIFILPVFLTILLYRLGIFIANTVFGSLRLEKFGKLVKRVIKGERAE